ncbi:alpha-amylase family protein [Alkalicoccobacillus porphyridii]|uniref:Family 10 glycosylhydrolase n=1 Tax=Alkalicoccobacillus porphyridii TaxID=2597270 RepID=A0A554A250_9BACI|nr:alpha-amylase family protein [Alkalicoccobacillus porphyridii]TSB47755.1 family 10 glycosylhydrolase [Alkalicoccobacillus porphyridii]
MDKQTYQKDPDFWNTRFRLIQPNLRKIDAINLDIEELINEVKEYGANAILVNGGGIVAWYPTTNAYQKVNEYMHGDFLGDIIAAAHRANIKVLVRMDVSKSHPYLLETHPDWFRRDSAGDIIKHWEMLTTCPTGPYWEEYNFRVLEELLNKYPADGIFFNAFNYLRCNCKRCQTFFKEQTGFDLPTEENWQNPAWRAYVSYRYERHADYNRRLAEFVNKVSPGTVLTIDTNITSDSYKGIRESGWHTVNFSESNGCITSEAFNLVDRPFPKWSYWAGEEVKIGNHLKQTSIILSYSKSIFSRRAAQPAVQFGYDLMQIAANGGAPFVALSGTFEQEDKQALPMTKKIYTYLKTFDQEYNDMTPLADVAIIYSQRTADYYGKEHPAERWQAHYRGMYEILAESHIPFTVLHEGCLSIEKLQNYSCLILPNIAALSDEEASLIDRYVDSGGHIISTYETGLYDHEGQRRSEQALKCVGREVRGSVKNAYTYLEVRNQSFIEDYPDTSVLMFTGDFLETVEKKDHMRLVSEDLYGIPSVRNTTPEFAYWEKVSDSPGLTIHSHGEGSVAYLPWSPDKLYHLMGIHEYKSLIAGLVKRFCGALSMESNAPGGVECLLAKRKSGGYLIHLVNGVGTQGKPLTETVKVEEIQLKVKGRFQSAKSLTTGEHYNIKKDGEYSSMIVRSLGLFEAIIIE